MLNGSSRARRLHAALLAFLVLCSADPLFAQEAKDSELSPPRLTESVEPQFPPEEKARGATATVVLTLDIDDEGRVGRAVVATSGGAAFDAAALEAANRLRFAPATRGGRPIRSKIPFQFAFNLAPEERAPEVHSSPPAASPASTPNPQTEKSDGAPDADDDGENGGFVDIQVRGQRAPRESTKQVLEPREIATMPGANGDALHAVENLPGVARPSGVSS